MRCDRTEPTFPLFIGPLSLMIYVQCDSTEKLPTSLYHTFEAVMYAIGVVTLSVVTLRVRKVMKVRPIQTHDGLGLGFMV